VLLSTTLFFTPFVAVLFARVEVATGEELSVSSGPLPSPSLSPFLLLPLIPGSLRTAQHSCSGLDAWVPSTLTRQVLANCSLLGIFKGEEEGTLLWRAFLFRLLWLSGKDVVISGHMFVCACVLSKCSANRGVSHCACVHVCQRACVHFFPCVSVQVLCLLCFYLCMRQQLSAFALQMVLCKRACFFSYGQMMLCKQGG
jgi:hypothetical protein